MRYKIALVCDYVEGHSAVPTGRLAYVLRADPVRHPNRLLVLARGRGGWVERWERHTRLGLFRTKAVAPDSPRYERVTDYSDEAQRNAVLAVTTETSQPASPSRPF